jgi:ABC-type branched-subunit amino acid transport system ATPase component
LAVGLAFASSVFKAIVGSGYQPILAVAGAAGTALLVTFASGLAGRLFSRFAGPYLVAFRSFYIKGIDRAIDRIGALFGKAPLIVSENPAAKITHPVSIHEPKFVERKADHPVEPLLVVSDISKRFGGVIAVDSVTLSLNKGEILGLIGPNGSGKTTVFNLVSGVYPIDAGTVKFDGVDISNADPTRIVREGVSRTFQNIRLFSKMSVLDNVQTALHGRSAYSLAEAFVQWPWTVRPAERRLKEEAAHILDTVGLGAESGRVAGTLPYGLQRKLEIARAIALKPKLLLLDEPAAGMNPKESEELVELIRRIHANSDPTLAIILIEHHMDVVMNLCRRIAVLNFGKKIAEGDPDSIQSDPAVLKAYLGDKTNAALS